MGDAIAYLFGIIITIAGLAVGLAVIKDVFDRLYDFITAEKRLGKEINKLHEEKAHLKYKLNKLEKSIPMNPDKRKELEILINKYRHLVNNLPNVEKKVSYFDIAEKFYFEEFGRIIVMDKEYSFQDFIHYRMVNLDRNIEEETIFLKDIRNMILSGKHEESKIEDFKLAEKGVLITIKNDLKGFTRHIQDTKGGKTTKK